MNLKNLFLPTPANNFRAYLISNYALVFYVILLIIANIFFGNIGIEKTYALLDQNKIIELHNLERKKHNLNELNYNATLSRSAQLKGQVMLEYNCWSHYCPEGKSPWDFFKTAGYSYSFAGENLAEGFSDSEAVMQAWMNSKTHKENILKDEFTEIGIAMITGNFQGINNNVIIVVHFGKPKSQNIIKNLDNNEIQNNIDEDNNDSTNISNFEQDQNNFEFENVSGQINKQTTSINPSIIQKGNTLASDNTNIFELFILKISSLNTVQIIGASLVFLLIVLFSLDIIMIKKYELKHHTKIKSKSRLHLPTFLILLLLIIMGNLDVKI